MHLCPLKVRSYECDLYNHVNHAVYLNYLEYARVEMLKDHGIDFFEMAAQGIQLVISEIQIKYISSAVADDNLVIQSVTLESGAAYGILSQTILRGEEILTTAQVKFVCTDKIGRPRRFDQKLKDLFKIALRPV